MNSFKIFTDTNFDSTLVGQFEVCWNVVEYYARSAAKTAPIPISTAH